MAYPSFETLDISVGLNYYKTRLASQFIYYEDAIDSEVTGAAERIAVIRPRLIGSTSKQHQHSTQRSFWLQELVWYDTRSQKQT